MRQVAKKGLLTAVATGSVLASTAGYAYASAEAHGGAANLPGVGSGNSVQAPADAPVNACGNTVNVAGVLDPASGRCGAGSNGDGARAGSSSGGSRGSAGLGSGNKVQAPVDAPVNACGNSLSVVGLRNSALADHCDTARSHSAAPGTGDDDCPPITPIPVPHPGGDDCPPSPAPSPPGDDCPPSPVPSPNPDCPPSPTPTPPNPSPSSPSSPSPSNPAPHPSGNPSNPDTPTPPSGGSSGGGSGPSTPAAPTPGGKLASTGADALELLGPAGLVLLMAGGVLYRRTRAGAR